MKIKYVTYMISLIGILSSESLAIPKNVIIIRHGEKTPGSHCLALQGLERAGALAYYFSGTPFYNEPPITHVIAARATEQEKSIRPYQTCIPIASHLHLRLESPFSAKEGDALAQDLLANPKYEGGTVLVCWSHGSIDKIVKALGGEDPGFWDEDIFDQVYMLTFKEKNKPVFQRFLQKLMFGDRKTFQDKPHPLPSIPVKCPAASLPSLQ